jgi:hypothetical protein
LARRVGKGVKSRRQLARIGPRSSLAPQRRAGAQAWHRLALRRCVRRGIGDSCRGEPGEAHNQSENPAYRDWQPDSPASKHTHKQPLRPSVDRVKPRRPRRDDRTASDNRHLRKKGRLPGQFGVWQHPCTPPGIAALRIRWKSFRTFGSDSALPFPTLCRPPAAWHHPGLMRHGCRCAPDGPATMTAKPVDARPARPRAAALRRPLPISSLPVHLPIDRTGGPSTPRAARESRLSTPAVR